VANLRARKPSACSSSARISPGCTSGRWSTSFETTTSATSPGAAFDLGNASGGMRDMIPVIARCGVAAGADGLFIEVHENPDKGPSDGPNMLKLAGRQGDGVLISAATSPPFVKACLDQAGAGRKSCLVYTKLGALDPIRRPIGFVLRGAHHAENIRLGGARLDQQALAAAYAAENWSEVDRLVDDDVVRRHTACGTPQQVRDKLDEYRAIAIPVMDEVKKRVGFIA